jgi:hypothetical protein
MMCLLWSVAGKGRVMEKEEAERIRRTDHITTQNRPRVRPFSTFYIPPVGGGRRGGGASPLRDKMNLTW